MLILSNKIFIFYSAHVNIICKTKSGPNINIKYFPDMFEYGVERETKPHS